MIMMKKDYIIQRNMSLLNNTSKVNQIILKKTNNLKDEK